MKLYYIYKINSSVLLNNNYVLEDYTIKKARINKELISIGDNQIFDFIRQIRNINTDFESIEELYANFKIYVEGYCSFYGY